eukprot:TRINITY_DN4045_c0_g1_i1.p1 TRINITY_DN4045_c0_g1~~TRINITY_DN4045_c0_g1_i1.p1  ORF type:complete len:1000 (+),score=239.26 TRINITY_DN4045_c0_g1_i1:90-3089(+)
MSNLALSDVLSQCHSPESNDVDPPRTPCTPCTPTQKISHSGHREKEKAKYNAEVKEERRAGWVSVQTILALLCLLGVALTAWSVALLGRESCSMALGRTEDYGERAKTQCFDVSQQSLKATAMQMFGPAQSSLRKQTKDFLGMAVVEAIRFRGYINQDGIRDAPHDWEFLKDSLKYFQSGIQSWRSRETIDTGPAFLGPYPRENGPAPFGGVGLVMEDTDIGVAISERKVEDIRTSVTAYSHPGLYPPVPRVNAGGVFGITNSSNGAPMLHLEPPLAGNLTRLASAARGVQLSRTRPRLYPVGSGRFWMIETLGAYLGTAYIHKLQDPSDENKVLEVMILLPLTVLEDHVVSTSREFCQGISEQQQEQCLEPRMYFSIKDFWYVRALQARNESWEAEVQTNILVAASHGGSSRTRVVPGAPFPLAFPISDVEASDPVIKNVAQYIHSLPGSYAAIHARDGFVVDDVVVNETTGATEEYFVGVTDVVVADGVDWWLTVASATKPILFKIQNKQDELDALFSDEKDRIMTKQNEDNLLSGIIVVLIVVFMSIVTVLIARSVLKPILVVQRAMQRVAQMDLDIQPAPRSLMTEVHQMQRDFEGMVANLIEFRAFMPVVLPMEESDAHDDNDEGKARSPLERINSALSDKGSSKTSSGCSHHSGGMIGLRLGQQLSRCKVVLLSLSSLVFLTHQNNPTFLTTYVETLVSALLNLAEALKGAPEFADGTNLTVTWGLIGRVSDLPRRAVQLALGLNNLLQDKGLQPVLVGIAKASVFGGTVGSSKMRKMAGFGSVYAAAAELRFLNSQYRTLVLCDDGMYSAVKYEYVARVVDVVLISGDAEKGTLVATVVAPNKTDADGADEWMYEMQKNKDAFDEAWGRFLSEPPDNCRDFILSTFESSADEEAKRSVGVTQLLELVSAKVDGRYYVNELTMMRSSLSPAVRGRPKNPPAPTAVLTASSPVPGGAPGEKQPFTPSQLSNPLLPDRNSPSRNSSGQQPVSSAA